MHEIQIFNCLQGSLEWVNLRIGLITASKFAQIIKSGKGSDESKCKLTIIDNLSTEMLINKKLDTYQSQSMLIAVELEKVARKLYMEKTFNSVIEVGLIKIEGLNIACSPDGLVGDEGGLEIKCPEPQTHYKYLQLDDAPKEYIPQIQGSLWITGRKWWDFISYNPDFPEHLKLKIIRCFRDEIMIKKIQENALEVEQAVRNNIIKLGKI